MNIVTAKCPNCGATLKVNSETNDGVCQYCGTPFFTRDAINNYNTTVIRNTTNNISNTTTNNTTHNTYVIADNITMQTGNFKNLLSAGLVSWDAKDYTDAYDKFSRALELNPTDATCILFKSLCLAVIDRHIEGATAAYKRVFGRPNFPYREKLDFAKNQLEIFDRLLIAETDAALSDYSPDCLDTSSIRNAWACLEDVLDARSFAAEMAENIYAVDPSFKDGLVTILKNLLSVYIHLTSGWKWVMQLDFDLYTYNEFHPLKEHYMRERAVVTNRIQSLDSGFMDSSGSERKPAKGAKIIKIIGIVGGAIFIGIVIALILLKL